MTGHGEKRSNGYWQGIKLKEQEINDLESICLMEVSCMLMTITILIKPFLKK